MASYFDAPTKAAINQVFSNLHESYGKTITAFKIGGRITIASNPDYNSFYKQNSSNTKYQEESQSFTARIKYISNDEEFFLERDGVSANNSQLKINLPVGSVRLKITAEGWAYIKDAKKIEFDGARYSIVSDGRPVGPFEINYYIIYLIPTDE